MPHWQDWNGVVRVRLPGACNSGTGALRPGLRGPEGGPARHHAHPEPPHLIPSPSLPCAAAWPRTVFPVGHILEAVTHTELDLGMGGSGAGAAGEDMGNGQWFSGRGKEMQEV